MNAPEHKEKTFLEEFFNDTDDQYFQWRTDLSPIINAWEKLDTKKFPHYKGMRSYVLSEWKKRPELHGLHTDTAIFEEHEDFILSVVSIKFSIDQISNPNGMFAIFSAGTMNPIWASDGMRSLRLETRDFIGEMSKIQTSAIQLILLLRIYGNKLDMSKLPIPRGDGFTDVLYYQPDPNKPKKYYRMRFDNEIYASNSWCVQMGVDGEVPPLTQEKLDLILENPFDSDHIAAIHDMRNFRFKGIGIAWAEEITAQYQQSLFQEQLLKKDALYSLKNLVQFQDQLSNVFRLPDLEVGIILTPFEHGSRRSRWEPYLKSLRFDEGIDPNTLDENDMYLRSQKRFGAINTLRETQKELRPLIKKGFQSLLVAPLMMYDTCIGIVEFASPHRHAFDFYVMFRLFRIAHDIASAIRHVQEGEQEKLMAVIKQTCTAIHPSVEWRFQEMAKSYLDKQARGEIPTPDPVVFGQVIPLYGGSDIRGSSRKRNDAIRADLLKQLDLAAQVINTAKRKYPRPVFDELRFRIGKHRKTIAKDLRSGDESRIYAFLRHVVESSFDELSALDTDVATKVQTYKQALDPKVGVIYHVRKEYDKSVSMINDSIGAYLEKQQEEIQRILPHYFEKFKTDGVDYNIYVGDSLLENGSCSPLALRNLYLWQLMVTCGIVWLTKGFRDELPTPLDTAHLLLLQSTPLNISFHMEEKHFSVDGAYNARYEIVKKRIDKACILETGERLTQPGQVAIVYTQESEAHMYREFISYLQDLGYLKKEYIDVLLEDLQGVHGLRAFRVKVAENAPKGWDADSIQPISEAK
jgi:hypothetical protein